MVLSFPSLCLPGRIPAAIIGGVSFILYGMISAIGVRNVVENRVDFINSRNLIIAAVILVCGLGFTDGLTFHVGGVTITLTSLAVAAIAGIVLNAILPGNDFHFGSRKRNDVASLEPVLSIADSGKKPAPFHCWKGVFFKKRQAGGVSRACPHVKVASGGEFLLPVGNKCPMTPQTEQAPQAKPRS